MHLLKKLGFAPRGTRVGSFPLEDPNLYTFQALSSLDKPLLQLILALDRLPSILHCDAVALQTVSEWVDCSSNIRCVGKLYEQYAGHIIALRIKDEKTFQSWQEFNIKTADLASPDEPHYLRIYSLYGHNRVVTSHLFMELLKGIFLGNGHCRAVGGLCSTKDGFSLTQSIGLTQSLVIRQNGVNVTLCYGDIASIFQAVGDCTLAHVQKILL